MIKYKLGSDVKVTGRFYTEAKALADPTAVLCSILTPAGRLTTYTYSVSGITKSSTGVYYVTIDATEVGQYSVRWYSTGTGKASDETEFTVVDVNAR